MFSAMIRGTCFCIFPERFRYIKTDRCQRVGHLPPGTSTIGINHRQLCIIQHLNMKFTVVNHLSFLILKHNILSNLNCFKILSLVMASTLAAPATSTTNRANTSPPHLVTGAIRHVNQLNEDGSYFFDYESIDGSFRTEIRDVNGLVHGRYGFFDPDGMFHEIGKGTIKKFITVSKHNCIAQNTFLVTG